MNVTVTPSGPGRSRRSFEPSSPTAPNDRLRDTPEDTLTGPSRRHWLGTTNFSEDMLSRMIHACRVTLAIGLIATSISTMIGIAIGGLMGYYAGWLDLIGMRLIEIFEAIPTLVLLLIVTVAIGRNLYLIMVVIGLLSWMSDARFIRAEFLRIRKLDYVQAAVAAGLGRMSIIFRHMLPNGVSPVFVNASFGIAGAILLEHAQLSGPRPRSRRPELGPVAEPGAFRRHRFRLVDRRLPRIRYLPDRVLVHSHRRGDARRDRPEAEEVAMKRRPQDILTTTEHTESTEKSKD